MPSEGGLVDGPAVVTGALYSLYGAEFEPTVETFVAEVTVGKVTGGGLVGSRPVQ